MFGKLRRVTAGRGSCVTVRLVGVRCVTACYGDARLGLAMFGSHGIASPGEVSRVDVGSVVAR